MTEEHDTAVDRPGEALPPPVSEGIPPGARRIAALAGLLLVPTIVLGHQLGGMEGATGVTIGGLLALANFWVLARIVVKLTSGEEVAPATLVGRLMVKFGGLGVALAVLVMVLEVDPLGLLLGLSVLIVAIVVAQLLSWVL